MVYLPTLIKCIQSDKNYIDMFITSIVIIPLR